jgi:hypothetical protein
VTRLSRLHACYARISLTDDATALLAVDVSGHPGNLWLVTLR